MRENLEMTPDMKVFVIRGNGLNSGAVLPQGVLDWATKQRSVSPQMIATDYPTYSEFMMNILKEAGPYWKDKLMGGKQGGPVTEQAGETVVTAPSATTMDAPESNEVPEQEQYGSGAVRNWQERQKIMEQLKNMGI